MNTLSKFLKCSIAAVMIFGFASLAFAQLPEGDRAKMGKDWESRFNTIIKELNLTPEQQQAIGAQRSQDRARSQELRQKIKSARKEITAELDKEVTDTAKVDSLVAQMKELTGDRIEQQIQGIMSLKNILTPEQFKALNAKKEHNHKRNERRQGGKR
ncbi:MAG: periplasmic heavy metal sensor [Candidatus Omnitrophota bacterium]